MLFSLATPLHWSASARSEWLYKPSAAPKKSCHFLLKTLLALSCGLKQPQTLSLLSAPACSSGFAGTSKFCRLMQASRPKWQGKTCSRNLFFAWSSHVPKHLWSVRPTALRQQLVFLGFQKSLVNPRFPQGLGLSKAPPLLQFPAQTRQAAAASLQLPRVHHAFQGEKPRLATDPLAPSGAWGELA